MKAMVLAFFMVVSTLASHAYSTYDEKMEKMQEDVHTLFSTLKSHADTETREKKKKAISKKNSFLSEEEKRVEAMIAVEMRKKEQLNAAKLKLKKLQEDNLKAQQETQRLFEAIMLSEKKRLKEEAYQHKQALARQERAIKREERQARMFAEEEKRKKKQRLKRRKVKAEKLRLVKKRREANALLAKVDVSEQKMRVYRGKKLLYSWKVSTGKKGFRTPRGKYSPKHMTKMHYSRKYNNAPMPYAIFFKGGYAIHGTTSVRRLGRPASHGCVRLKTSNAKKFYKLVRKSGRKNTRIQIVN